MIVKSVSEVNDERIFDESPGSDWLTMGFTMKVRGLIG